MTSDCGDFCETRGDSLWVLGPPHLLEQRIRDRGISTHECGGGLVTQARLASPAARPRLVHEAVSERRSAEGPGRIGRADEHPTVAIENLERDQVVLERLLRQAPGLQAHRRVLRSAVGSG